MADDCFAELMINKQPIQILISRFEIRNQGRSIASREQFTISWRISDWKLNKTKDKAQRVVKNLIMLFSIC